MADYSEQRSKKDTILIVDDLSASAIECENVLEKAGYHTVVVNNATEAMEFMQRKQPVLILTDLYMPGIDGYEFCEMLKRKVTTRDIPVIILTGTMYHDTAVRCFQAGAVDVIRRPFYDQELVARVSNAVRLVKKNKQLEDYNNNLYKLLNEQMRGILLEQANIIKGVIKLLEIREELSLNRYEEYSKNCGMLATGLMFSSKYDMEVSSTFIELLENVAPFTNIGKVAIPDEILKKKEPFTKEEEAIYRKHPEYGAKAFTGILDRGMYSEFYKMAVQVTYYHHENWNGSGYPKGLSGLDIPLAARIVAVVGAFEDFIRDSYYRPAYTREEAANKIIEASGANFDPEIVEVFEKIWRQFL